MNEIKNKKLNEIKSLEKKIIKLYHIVLVSTTNYHDKEDELLSYIEKLESLYSEVKSKHPDWKIKTLNTKPIKYLLGVF